MARVLAVCEAGAGGILRPALAAAALAQRFAAESKAEADFVALGATAAAPGKWARSFHTAPVPAAAAAAAVAALVAEGGYGIVAVGDTASGRELAGRLSARLRAPVVASALSLRRNPQGVLQAARPIEGGARTALFDVVTEPFLLLVDADSSAAPGASTARTESELLPTTGCEPRFRLVGETRLTPAEMDVTEADVVVAGGRGVGPEGFRLLEELAGLLGGTVGASRVAVDLGWVPYSRQVGLTGRSVAPRLYVACGISGAIHHTLGMRDSSFIVAINSDARAPIFKIANASVVGDLHEVLPALISELRARGSAAERVAALAGVRR